MKRKKTNNGFATILSSLLMIMLVVIVIGFLYYRTDGLTTGIKEFYVKNGGNTFISDYSNFGVVVGREYKFDIVNTKDNLTNNETNYKLSIVPNTDIEETNFTYQVDGVNYKFHDLGSITRLFTISTNNNYFILSTDTDLAGMFQNLYWGSTITGVPTTIDSNVSYYKLVISSVGENVATININFNLKSE